MAAHHHCRLSDHHHAGVRSEPGLSSQPERSVSGGGHNSLLVGLSCPKRSDTNATHSNDGVVNDCCSQRCTLREAESGKLDHFSGHGVCLHAQMHGGCHVIGATGELDASNIHHLTDFVRRYLGARPPTGSGSQPARFPCRTRDRCLRDDRGRMRPQRHRMGLGARPCSRSGLLRICDLEHRLPVVSSIDEAVQRFSASVRPQALLQLVAKSS